MDTEELEKELDSLLQDSTKEPVDLPPAPQKVLNPPISDAELEAELEKLSVADGGTGVSYLLLGSMTALQNETCLAELKSEPESFSHPVRWLKVSSPGIPARCSLALSLTTRLSLERTALFARNSAWASCHGV